MRSVVWGCGTGRGPDFRFWVGFRCRFRLRLPFRLPVFWSQFSAFGVRVEGQQLAYLGIGDWGLGIGVLGFGFQVPGPGLHDSVFRFRVLGFGFRFSGFGKWDKRPVRQREREFFIDNLLVRTHFIIEMIWWTGLAPWEFEITFSR